MELSPLELVFLVPLIVAVGWFIVTNLFMGGFADYKTRSTSFYRRGLGGSIRRTPAPVNGG